jgi:hypothetical protein
MIPGQILEPLNRLREDYARVTGFPFEQFYCPILCRDEQAELCLGHVVNQAIPNSCRTCVVQRKDVDGFFGRMFETDFVTLINCQSSTLLDVLHDPSKSKKLKPKIDVEGEECRFHHYRGHSSAEQSPIMLESNVGDPIHLVFHKNPQDMVADRDKKWQISVEADFRLSALVSLIKAAYLTLFRLLGYRYALSAAGSGIGYDILGRFYRENSGKSVQEVREAALSFFSPYIHMVRPILAADGTPLLGTVEDHRAMVCFGSSGRPYALLVSVRTNEKLHGVLMPGFSHPDSVAVYHEFLNNDKELLRANECVFNPAKNQWDACDQTIEIAWPKRHETFGLK